MKNAYVVPQSQFSFGELYVTAAADRTINRDDISIALNRHADGDWGDVRDEEKQGNDSALAEGYRLFSVYHDRNGVEFWIVTERDRSATTVLMPDDY